ncbi:MAG TPA: PRC-barrel domain-containing protein [Ktedonobacterales bacterium]
MIEQLRIGAPVYTSDGKRVGSLERIIVANAETEHGSERRVTGLVVDPGFRDLGDLLSPGSVERSRARSVPIEQAASVSEDEIRLSGDAKAFVALPLFERREYIAAGGEPTHRRFRWDDIINYAAATFGLGAAPYMPDSQATAFDEAAGSASLPARAPVWREDPHEEIGQIERTLVESGSERVTGFVLRRERVDTPLVVLPVEAITSIEDGLAHVALTDTELDNLQPYEE